MCIFPHLPLQRGQPPPSQKIMKVKDHKQFAVPKGVLDATDDSDTHFLVMRPFMA